MFHFNNDDIGEKIKSESVRVLLTVIFYPFQLQSISRKMSKKSHLMYSIVKMLRSLAGNPSPRETFPTSSAGPADAPDSRGKTDERVCSPGEKESIHTLCPPTNLFS